MNMESGNREQGPQEESGMAERLEKAIEQEVAPSHVSLHFNLNRHAAPEDATSREELEPYDIVLYEGAGFTPAFEKNFQRVSDGEMSVDTFFQRHRPQPEDMVYADFRRAELEALSGTHKAVAFLDLPRGHGLLGDFALAVEIVEPPYIEGEPVHAFQQAVGEYAGYVDFNARLFKEREDYLIKKIPQVLKKILDQHPELQGKQNIRVLIMMGAAHTRVGHEAKKTYETTRSLPYNPFAFSHFEEYIRMRGFNVTPNEQLKRNVLLSMLITYALQEEYVTLSLEGVQLERRKVRKALAAMSDEEGARLYDAWRQGGYEGVATHLREHLPELIVPLEQRQP